MITSIYEEYNNFNESTKYDSRYCKVMLNKSTGKLWIDMFVSGDSYNVYNNTDVTCLSDYCRAVINDDSLNGFKNAFKLLMDNKIKALRLLKNISQKQLADLTGLSQPAIAKIETGINDINNVSGAVLLKLATALECTIEELLK